MTSAFWKMASIIFGQDAAVDAMWQQRETGSSTDNLRNIRNV
jgi:hypothetical protein